MGRRQYMIGIVPDDPDRFPYYATEEHQEMIVIDLNCKDNLANVLNQVRSKDTYKMKRFGETEIANS